MQPRPDSAKPFVLLEDRTATTAARLYTDPAHTVCCWRPEEVTSAFEAIEDGLKSGLHAAGYCAYELGYVLEPKLARLLPNDRRAPLLWFGLFPPPQAIAPKDLDEMLAAAAPSAIRDLVFDRDRADHVHLVGRVLELIGAGDLYQANLTFPIHFRYDGDPLALYAALRARQPVAFGGMVSGAEGSVLSVSPELFVSIDGDVATARPMKGTTPRLADEADDKAARTALARDEKQRAENLMIVDLLRNDLSRISQPRTVRVPALFTVETYPTFHTLTSTITAKLLPGVGVRERLASLFPCGSIVGAPKIRAAEVIRDLEPEPRGVYTGALGVIAPDGDMRFNVAIRTAWIGPDGEGRYGVGGGIVADSDPDAEYDEALLKGRVLTDLAADFGLIETFAWLPDQGFVRLGRHLARLAASARALDFRFDQGALSDRLAEAAVAWSATEGAKRVRLELARSGETTLTHGRLDASAPSLLRLGLADARLDAGDPFLRHKTTRREVYERAFAVAAADGLDEAILLNRGGTVADCCRASLFAELDGRLVTPTLASGALDGVLRASLIEQGSAIERDLTVADLHRASRLFVGSSLRGLREGRLAQSELSADGAPKARPHTVGMHHPEPLPDRA